MISDAFLVALGLRAADHHVVRSWPSKGIRLEGGHETTAPESPPSSRPFFRRLPWLDMKLSGVQAAVGLVAGVLSIVGGLQALPSHFTPPAGRGELTAVVVDSKTDKAVADATVEVLALNNAVVTTRTSGYFGKARATLAEGEYRIRVSHPKYGAEVRSVHVISGQSGEVRVRLHSGISAPLREAGRVIGAGIDAVKRLFGD